MEFALFLAFLSLSPFFLYGSVIRLVRVRRKWTFAGGKPITPNDVADSLSNGHAVENGAVNESVTKTEVSAY